MSAKPGVSVVYVTHREEPAFGWFADGLARQLGDGDELELVLVDGLWTAERAARFEALAAGRFPCRCVPAKPTPYNGAHRLTPADCFASASARNTGLVYAALPYVVFADDCSVPMPGWWDEARAAAAAGHVVAGAYRKQRAMEVQDGLLVRGEVVPHGIDTRWELGADDRTTEIVGGQLYGCSFGVPRELLLAVDGVDELCDPIGGEDYHLGMRLEWAGAQIRYSRRMLTVESEELHAGGPQLVRIGLQLDEGTYMERLRAFGVEQRSTDGDTDSSHLVLDLLLGTRTTRSLGNPVPLDRLGEASLHTLPELFPRTYWVDGRPLAELTPA